MVVKITKIDERKVLCINNEMVEIDDFQVKSSADGSTELSIIIKCVASTFETSAIIKEKK